MGWVRSTHKKCIQGRGHMVDKGVDWDYLRMNLPEIVRATGV